MSYVNINNKTDIVFMNGMDNTFAEARNSANLIQRGFLNKQVGIMNNATRGLFNDFGEWKNKALTTKDSLNAYQLRKLTKNSRVLKNTLDSTNAKDFTNSKAFKDFTNAKDLKVPNFRDSMVTKVVRDSLGSKDTKEIKDSQLSKNSKTLIVLTHSAAHQDIIKANYLNALKGIITDYNLISIGSPISERELEESTRAVGAKLVKQVNHPFDPIRVPQSVDEALGNRIYFAPIPVGGYGGIGLGGIQFKLNKYHPFESYYNNPEFQIKETIQNIFIEDAIKRINERRFIYERE